MSSGSRMPSKIPKMQRKLQQTLKELQVRPQKMAAVARSRSPPGLANSETGESSVKVMVPKIAVVDLHEIEDDDVQRSSQRQQKQRERSRQNPLFAGVLKQKGTKIRAGSYQIERFAHGSTQPSAARRLAQKVTSGAKLADLTREAEEPHEEAVVRAQRSSELPQIAATMIEQSAGMSKGASRDLTGAYHQDENVQNVVRINAEVHDHDEEAEDKLTERSPDQESAGRRREGRTGMGQLNSSADTAYKELLGIHIPQVGQLGLHQNYPSSSKVGGSRGRLSGHHSPVQTRSRSKLDQDFHKSGSTHARRDFQAMRLPENERKDTNAHASAQECGLAVGDLTTLPLMNISQIGPGNDYQAGDQGWLGGPREYVRDVNDCISVEVQAKNTGRQGRNTTQASIKIIRRGSKKLSAADDADVGGPSLIQSCDFGQTSGSSGLRALKPISLGQAGEPPRGRAPAGAAGSLKHSSGILLTSNLATNQALSSVYSSSKELGGDPTKLRRVAKDGQRDIYARDRQGSKLLKSPIYVGQRGTAAALKSSYRKRSPLRRQGPKFDIHNNYQMQTQTQLGRNREGAAGIITQDSINLDIQLGEPTDRSLNTTKRKLESNFKPFKRNSIAIPPLQHQLQAMQIDTRAGTGFSPHATCTTFSMHSRNKFPIGKKLSLRNSAMPEATDRMRITTESFNIQKGYKQLEDDSRSPSPRLSSGVLVLSDEELQTATDRLLAQGAAKLTKMIAEKKNRIDGIKAMIEAEKQVFKGKKGSKIGPRRRTRGQNKSRREEKKMKPEGDGLHLHTGQQAEGSQHSMDAYHVDENKQLRAPVLAKKLNKKILLSDLQAQALATEASPKTPRKLHPDDTLTHSRDQYSLSISKEWRHGLAASMGVGGTASGGLVPLHADASGTGVGGLGSSPHRGPRKAVGIFNNSRIGANITSSNVQHSVHSQDSNPSGLQSGAKFALSNAMHASLNTKMVSAEETAPAMSADAADAKHSTPDRLESIAHASDTLPRKISPADGLEPDAPEASADDRREQAQQSAAKSAAQMKEWGQKKAQPQYEKASPFVLAASPYRPSRFAESISKPLNLPSLRKPQEHEGVTSGPSPREGAADEVVTQAPDREAVEALAQAEDKELVEEYLVLLRKEGELLHRWRGVMLGGPADSADRGANAKHDHMIRAEDSAIARASERPDAQLNELLRERALEQANSTMTKADKYRFKGGDNPRGGSLQPSEPNKKASLDSKASTKREEPVPGNQLRQREQGTLVSNDMQSWQTFGLDDKAKTDKKSRPSPRAAAQGAQIPPPREVSAVQRPTMIKTVIKSPKASLPPPSIQDAAPAKATAPFHCDVAKINGMESIQQQESLIKIENHDEDVTGSKGKVGVVVKSPPTIQKAMMLPGDLQLEMERGEEPGKQCKTRKPSILGGSHLKSSGLPRASSTLLGGELDQIMQSLSSISQTNIENHIAKEREQHLPQLLTYSKLNAKQSPRGGAGSLSGGGASARARTSLKVQTSLGPDQGGLDSGQLHSGDSSPEMTKSGALARCGSTGTRTNKYASQQNPQNLNLMANPAKTKYRKYSKAKGKRECPQGIQGAIKGRKEQMIDELVNQIYDIAAANAAAQQHSDGAVQLPAAFPFAQSSTIGFHHGHLHMFPSDFGEGYEDIKEIIKGQINQQLRKTGSRLSK